MIKISSVDDENNIFLIVEDNGVGMQPEQVVQINKEMYEDIWVNRTTGFGIANVNRRIKLYYGEEYGLILESEPDIGTKVIVVVPKTRQAEKIIKNQKNSNHYQKNQTLNRQDKNFIK